MNKYVVVTHCPQRRDTRSHNEYTKRIILINNGARYAH